MTNSARIADLMERAFYCPTVMERLKDTFAATAAALKKIVC